MTEDEMVGCHHRLNGHEYEQTPGVGDGQGVLACCSPWGRKESDTTERLHSLTHSGANSFIIVSWPAQSVYSPSPFGSVQSLSHVRLFATP